MNARLIAPALFMLSAGPALAAGKDKPFFSLANTDFIVTMGFIVFIGILIYYKVPGMIGGLLDKRAEGIASELDEAKSLREEAQALLASYERKSREVQDQADRIVAQAKEEAEMAAVQARADLEKSITRRLAAAQEQIASAEGKAVRHVRDQAISIAIAAAGDVIGSSMKAADRGKLVDDAIATVGAKLH